jgi:hypothetical protein
LIIAADAEHVRTRPGELTTPLFATVSSPLLRVIAQGEPELQLGRLKVMFLIPGVEFAVVIASRRVQVASQTPSPLSLVRLTTRLVVIGA